MTNLQKQDQECQENKGTSFETVKQIGKQNSKEVWMSEEIARPLVKYLS